MIGGGNILAKLNAKLGLDESDYVRGMVNAQTSNRIFGETFTGFVSNPLTGSIELLRNVGGWLVRNSQETLAYAETIERLSQQTGASEPLLIALQKRLEIAGFSAERARQSFLVFNKFIADYANDGPIANEVLRQTGVNLEGLAGFDQVFRAMVEGLSQISDPAARAAVSMKLFGEEAGHDVINAIGGGNAAIDEMIDQYTRLGFVIERGANSQLAALNTNLGFAQQAMEGVKQSLLNEFLIGLSGSADLSNESMIRLAETMNTNFAPAARESGQYLGDLANGVDLFFGGLNKLNDLITNGFGADVFFKLSEFGNLSIAPGSRGNAPGTIFTPPTATEAQLRNRERGQEYLQELVP